MGIHLVSVKKNGFEDELKYNGVTLLTYRIEYPEFCSSCFIRCLAIVNRFYKDRALEFKRYCETELFGMAVAQYIGDMENNFPVRVFDAQQIFEVTCLCSCIISLYVDRYEYTGGAHGNTIRSSQTWKLQKCAIVWLRQLVCCPPDYITYILSEVQAQIEENPDIYFDNYEELIVETFNENSYYCTLEGIVVYYQQYDIAPYSSGIREFLIPYGWCVLDPVKMCGLM